MAVLKNGLLKRMAYVVGVFMAGMLHAEMTFSDLQSAIADAADGATVYVANDIEYTGCLIDGIAKRITLASPEGQTNVLMRASSYGSGAFMKLSDDAGQVTIRNLIVDGNKAKGTMARRFVEITAGTLTLESGAELRNVKQSWNGTIRLTGTGQLVMNDGSVIRGFENSGYGTAIQVGEQRKKEGVFTMNGGLITECASLHSTIDEYGAGAYGGAVYLYGGTAYLYGGSITGNRGAKACAGVAAYDGRLHFKGTASVTNNVGEIVNDISCWNDNAGGWIMFDGPWTGRATVYAPRVLTNNTWIAYVQAHEGFDPTVGFMKGLGNLSVQDHEEWVANGYVRGKTESPSMLSVSFAKRTARLDGRVTTATLAEAFDSAGENAVVELLRDLDPNSTMLLTNGANVVLRSAPGTIYSIQRRVAQEGSALFKVGNQSSLTFEDIVLDGNGDASTSRNQASMLYVAAEGTVTLGKGAILQNGVTEKERPAVYAAESGSHFIMEEGGIVRNFRTTSAGSWATAIRIGQNSAQTVPPVFTMNGGMISNCVSDTTDLAKGGYGGAVYVQQGNFYMNGGTITENSASTGGAAGVMAWDGAHVYFSGTAIVTNNPGLKPDVYRADGGRLYMRGVFRGCVGVSSGDQLFDKDLQVYCEEGATGAWNFFSAGTDPYAEFIGYMWYKNRSVYLGTANGWVDGKGVDCRYENTAHFTPTAIDADIEALPHVFGGSACSAGGPVTVTFDEAAARAAGRTVIPLVAAQDGDVLTGAWTFTVPPAGKGVWKVKTVSSATGVTAYNLVWCPPGGAILIR